MAAPAGEPPPAKRRECVGGDGDAGAARCAWVEPGGRGDAADPHLPVPPHIRVVDAGNTEYWERRGGGGGVSDAEIEWMLRQRPLVVDEAQLRRDYGDAEAAAMLAAAAAAGVPDAARGAVMAPGVGTRWRRFCAWWRALPPAGRPAGAAGAFAGFARAVGRVVTYRALALDAAGYRRIRDADEIFPHGRLGAGIGEERMRGVVDAHGVAKVAACRLYISHRDKIGGLDPTVSLHDDWQTAAVIASGYAEDAKKVYLFELSVPAVESLGWSLLDVARRSGFLGAQYAAHDRWFCFSSPAVPEGVWFDATLQRTERYGMYSVPSLRNRLRRLYVFSDVAELSRAVRPFARHVAELHAAPGSDRLPDDDDDGGDGGADA